jgi:hypothetical protein
MVIKRTTRSNDTQLEVCRPEEQFSPLLILTRDPNGATDEKIMLDHTEIELLQSAIRRESAECKNCEGVEATEVVAGMDLCSVCSAAAKRGAREALDERVEL